MGTMAFRDDPDGWLLGKMDAMTECYASEGAKELLLLFILFIFSLNAIIRFFLSSCQPIS